MHSMRTRVDVILAFRASHCKNRTFDLLIQEGPAQGMEHIEVGETEKILALECLPSTELATSSLLQPQTPTPYQEWVTSEITKDPHTFDLTGGYYAHFLKQSHGHRAERGGSEPPSLAEKCVGAS